MQASDWVLSLINPNQTILDVGIGTGELWKAAKLQAQVKGFDIKNSNPGVEVVMGNVCLGLPFKQKSFNVGVMLNVLESLPDSCRQHAVNELARTCDVAIVVSKNPVLNYSNAGLTAEFQSDAVDGVQWFGMVLNKEFSPGQKVENIPPLETVNAPLVIIEKDKPEEQADEDEQPEDQQDEEKQKKKKPPFWKRPFVRVLRYASILVGVFNLIKYFFSNETVTVPIEVAAFVPIIGGSVTHYRIAMGTYEAIMTLKNYLSKA